MIVEKGRSCQVCSKPLKGRTDKKFCDDYCRNQYNNRHASGQYNSMRRINRILCNNRRILKEQLNATTGLCRIRKEALQELGYRFSFGTHIIRNKAGSVFHFTYDYGYLNLEQNELLLVKTEDAED